MADLLGHRPIANEVNEDLSRIDRESELEGMREHVFINFISSLDLSISLNSKGKILESFELNLNLGFSKYCVGV